MRDESIHLEFGCELINTIKKENPEVWTKDFEETVHGMIIEGVYWELEYSREACPEGVLGINQDQFADYVCYIADRRRERIGMRPYYKKDNPFPWMSQTTDLNKEKNFFETRVTENSPQERYNGDRTI